MAHGELRIVGEHGSDPDGHGVGAGAQAMYLAPRRLAGEPARLARVIGQRAVERERELELDERPVARQGVEEGGVELARRRLLHADGHVDPRFAEPLPRRRARRGSGPSHAATTRRTPAARIASVHGGVLP